MEKIQQVKKKIEDHRKLFMIFMIAIIILWPLIHAFLGVDLVDTGYYYYQYLHPRDWNTPYTGYLATLIGAVWVRIFPGLGLLALNILELLMEWTMCVIVYFTFRKSFGELKTLFSIMICELTISIYVNVFNYHQLSMFCCTLLICSMYWGLKNNKLIFFLISGVMGGLAFATRMPSILCVCCIACILYWRLAVDKDLIRMIKEVLLFIAGLVIMIAGFIGIVYVLGVYDRFMGSVFRLGSLGQSSSSTYGVSGMSKNLILDSIHGITGVLVFLMIVLAIIALAQFCISIYKKSKAGGVILGIISLGISGALFIYVGKYAVYVLPKAPNFIQLTSYIWFMYGAFLLYGIIETIRGLFVKSKEERAKGALAFMGVALMLLCFVGSAARSKHAILGFWVLFILFTSRFCGWMTQSKDIVLLKKVRLSTFAYKSGLSLSAVFIGVCFVHFICTTNNFDDPNLFNLTESIHNERVVGLKTSKREADAVNEVLGVLEEYKPHHVNMMVIGNSIGLYSMTDYKAYVKPWVYGSSYTVNDLKSDIETAEAENRPLPVIVWSKTNAYLGFAQEDYEKLLSAQNRTYKNSPKTKVIEEFMQRYHYTVTFENDYFKVIVPEG